MKKFPDKFPLLEYNLNTNTAMLDLKIDTAVMQVILEYMNVKVTMVSGYAIKGAGKRIRFQSNDHRPSVHSISSVRKPLSTREEWSSSGDHPARAGNLFILLFLAI
ncbi:hypothetical protein ANTRET_LOCUS2069 [Anthophora retusa]